MEACVHQEWNNSAQSAIKERQFEEYAGRRRFFLDFDQNSIFEYEKRMLKESGCQYTLPMNFIYEQEKLRAYYDFTEFIILDEYINRKVSSIASERKNQLLLSDSLEVVINIIKSLKGMENYLLFPDRMEIEISTIFIHPDSNKVAFCFIPESKQGHSLQSRIIRITKEIKQLYNQEMDQYLDKFINITQNKNLGLDGMINTLSEFQREISYIYWEAKDFRALEERELPKADDMIEVGTRLNEKECLFKKSKYNNKMQMRLKPLIIQVAIILCITAIYLSGALEIESFAGLIILAGSADLWLMRKMKYV